MKKCINILLILFLFINSGGFIIIFYQAQNSVKSRVLRRIREGDFEVDNIVKIKLDKDKLFINTNVIIWKDEREFEYKGMLYDIIKIEQDKNDVILVCLSDFTESRIVENFNDEVNDLASGKINNSKYKTSLLNLIMHALCIRPYQLIQFDYQQVFAFQSFLGTPAPAIEILLPPPKAA